MQSEISETRKDYIKRINYVLDYVDNNLDADLSLKQLSEKAHYSSFHFHRIFSVLMGESINMFVNRKRIERIASVILVETNKPLHELAFKYGFNSDNSFSRAFKKYYGISPTKFKSEGNRVLSKIGIEPLTMEKYICSIDNIKTWIDMNGQIEVKEMQEMKLAGIMCIGKFEEIGKVYEKLMRWAAEKELLDIPGFKAVTIYHDNPRVTQISKVRFSACITINKDVEAQGDVRQLLIEKGQYVVGHFEITADSFQKAWDSTCIWVVENGYSFRDGSYFEMYNNDASTHPEHKFIVDICIPVEKRGNSEYEEKNESANYSDSLHYREGISHDRIQADYNQLIDFIKKLRTYFKKEYSTVFKVGTVYLGNMNFSYFSLTTIELKKLKLKFVIIFNHEKMRFEICLSGQNKSVRKKFWEIFKGSDWGKYHLAESIKDSLSIMDHVIVESTDINNAHALIRKVETESLKFINDIRAILE